VDLKDKKILITGADGFIGSHLTEMLVPQAAAVKALSQYNSFNTWGWLEEIDTLDDIEVISVDVRDPHFCRQLLQGVNVVFHLAALIAIPYSYAAPESYVDTNVKGTLNICQAAVENGCELLMHTSTSEVYGTAQYVPIDEEHPLQAQSPYSASKIGADALAMSFHLSFQMPLTIARPFNTYGPRQSARAIIPTIITQILDGKKKLKVGNLAPTRDLNYVKDTCRAMVELVQCDQAKGEIVNLGSNAEVSVAELIELIKELMGSNIEILADKQRLRPDNSEVYRLRCNNKKNYSLTGFKPGYTLREGLQETIEWFSDSSNIKNYKSEIYNV